VLLARVKEVEALPPSLVTALEDPRIIKVRHIFGLYRHVKNGSILCFYSQNQHRSESLRRFGCSIW
jgi:hypothetical protein